MAFVSQGPGQAPQGTRPCGKPASSSIVFPLCVWLFHSLDCACTSSLGSGWRGPRFRPVSAAHWALYHLLLAADNGAPAALRATCSFPPSSLEGRGGCIGEGSVGARGQRTRKR